MVIFKDKNAMTGRVRPISHSETHSQIALPVSNNRRKNDLLTFSYRNDHFYLGNKKIDKIDAQNLAKWILSHE